MLEEKLGGLRVSLDSHVIISIQARESRFLQLIILRSPRDLLSSPPDTRIRCLSRPSLVLDYIDLMSRFVPPEIDIRTLTAVETAFDEFGHAEMHEYLAFQRVGFKNGLMPNVRPVIG